MADGGGEPLAKKIKMSQKTVFDVFWQKTNFLKNLQMHVKEIETENYCFCMLKILKCNADEGFSFANAYCTTEMNMKTDCDGLTSLDAYCFSDIFKRGYSKVLDYVSDKNVPERYNDRIALERLLSVLMDVKNIEVALKNTRLKLNLKTGSKKEVDWTIAVAHHLLKKLAVNQTYIIDKHYPGASCLCTCGNERITGTFGDTSIGCTDVWHGYIDLILGNVVPVAAADKEDVEISDDNQSSIEVKQTVDFLAKQKDKLIAQAIVFSFLQKKERQYENYLIPCICISKDYVTLILYDSEKDILLEGTSFQFWSAEGDILVTSGLIALWLAINYSITCSGVTEHMLNADFTADFHKHVGKDLEIYQKCLQFGCGPGSETRKKFRPSAVNFLNLHKARA